MVDIKYVISKNSHKLSRYIEINDLNAKIFELASFSDKFY